MMLEQHTPRGFERRGSLYAPTERQRPLRRAAPYSGPLGLDEFGVLAAARGSAAWSPSNAAGLRAWYRYGVGLLDDAGGPVASGTDVTTWQDQSGNGHHVTQATAGKRPLWTSGVGVTFSAANQDYLHTGDAGGLTGNFNHSIFALLNTGTLIAGFNSMVSYGRSDSGSSSSVIGNNGVASNAYWFGGGAATTPQGGTSANNATIRLGKVHTVGVSTQGYVNGSAAGTASASTFTIVERGFLLNSRDTVSGFSNATIIEAVVYDAALSAPDLASLDAYFVALAASL